MASPMVDEPNVEQDTPLNSSLVVSHESAGGEDDPPDQPPSVEEPPLAARSFANLPLEIYLKILDERYYQDNKDDEDNKVNERRRVLAALARVSRHVNDVVTPIIYSTFSMGDGQEQRDHRGFKRDDRQPALLLRTLLERPDLAHLIKSVHIPEKEIGSWHPDESLENGVKVAIWLGPPPKEAEYPGAATVPSQPAQAQANNNLLYDTEPEDDGGEVENDATKAEDVPTRTSFDYEMDVWFDQRTKDAQDATNKAVAEWDSDDEDMGTDKASRGSSEEERESGGDAMELDEAGRSSAEEDRGRVSKRFKLKRARWLKKYVFNSETGRDEEDHDKKSTDRLAKVLMRDRSGDSDGAPDGTNFRAPDVNRAEEKIRELCEHPIWHFPAGQLTDWLVWGEFHNQSWEEGPHAVRTFNDQPSDAPYDKEVFAKDWIRCFKDGHYDAIYALLLSLMPEMTSLRLERWCTNYNEDGMPPGRLVNDYVSQFFRAAAQSQRNTMKQEQSETDHCEQSNTDSALLPKLRDIILYYADEQSRVPIALAIPYLLPPSVERATLVGIWDPSWFPTGRYPVYLDAHGIQEPGTGADSPEISQMHPRELPVLNLKMLRLRRSLLSAVSMGRLIKCCPKLEWLSYGQNKQPELEGEPVVEVDLDVRILQPYLNILRPTLLYIDFAVNGERDSRCWHLTTDHPERMEIWKGYFDFSGFEKLEDVTINCENFLDHGEEAISHPEVYQDLARTLPLRSLRSLILHNSLWGGPWDGIYRENGHHETRLVRVAQCFVNMLRENDSIVLKNLVFVAQADPDGANLAFHDTPPVVQELLMLCRQRGISFQFEYLEHEKEDVDEDVVLDAMSGDPYILGPLDFGVEMDDPDVKKFVRRVTSPGSDEEGLIRSGDEEGEEGEEGEDGDEDEEDEDVPLDDHFMDED